MKTALLAVAGITALVLMILLKQSEPMLALICFLAGVSTLLFAASCITTMPASPIPRTTRSVETDVRIGNVLITIPMSTKEVLRRFDYDEFELFSAAVVIGRRDNNYTFERRTGGSGDQGMDTILRNRNGLKIGVQSKFYSPDTKVGSEEIRTFVGSLEHHDCIYGYFVTTSTLTAEGRVALHRARGKVYFIDAHQLDLDLYYRAVTIEQAWEHVMEKHSAR